MTDVFQKQLKDLDDLLYVYSNSYYNDGISKISDSEYDTLVSQRHRLASMVKDASEVVVGAPVRADKHKVKHTIPMLSLNNAFDKDTIKLFSERIVGDRTVEHKVDGLACSLLYRDGILVQGSTRGNGIIGEDITERCYRILDIPHKLNGHNVPSIVEVRGEIYMDVEQFSMLNARCNVSGQKTFSNPRNAAAGSLQLHDLEELALRKLRFFAYGMVGFDSTHYTQTDVYDTLTIYGFSVVTYKVAKDLKEMLDIYEDYVAHRAALPYEIDGVVYKANSLLEQDELGCTSRAPRWAVAYKFPSMYEHTTIVSIVDQVGRTGTITPVAILSPVVVGGVIVRRASLYNYAEVGRLGVYPGDTVCVRRMGDVIPKVTNVIAKRVDAVYTPPFVCESCGCKVVKTGPCEHICSGGFLCPAQAKRRLLHFVSKDGLNICGLGPSIISLLYDSGYVRVPSDIFTLHQHKEIVSLSGLGMRRFQMLIDEIALRKSVCMSDFISALGIPNVGRQTAEVLANHFSGNVHRLVECLTDTGASLKIDSIGDVTMMCLRQYVINCRDVINTLLDYVLIIPDKTNTSAQTVVFTGKFTNLSRKEIEQVARHLGFKTNDTVTKDTTYLIVGENPGEKVDRARKLGVPVLSETQWAVLVGQYTSEFNNT